MNQSTTGIDIEKREMDKILSQLSEIIDISELTFDSAHNWKGYGMFCTYVYFSRKDGSVLEVSLRNNFDIYPKSLRAVKK